MPKAELANNILLDLRVAGHKSSLSRVHLDKDCSFDGRPLGGIPPLIKACSEHIHFAYGLRYTQQNCLDPPARVDVDGALCPMRNVQIAQEPVSSHYLVPTNVESHDEEPVPSQFCSSVAFPDGFGYLKSLMK